MIPDRFEDGRHLAFEGGAKAAGFEIRNARSMGQPRGRPGDLLMVWNLHGVRAQIAAQFETDGGEVLVAEEGYTRRIWSRKTFSASLHGHNGSGRWYPGGPERWRRLGLPVAPWRTDGRHVLVCGQRGIGAPGMASPLMWHEDAARRLRQLTDRPIVVRPHPGKDKAAVERLGEQLAGAWAVVVWSSGVALRAILDGIPVFVEAPHHVLDGAVQRGIEAINAPEYPDRLPALERMAWAQWTIEEIARGEAHRHLCSCITTAAGSAAA